MRRSVLVEFLAEQFILRGMASDLGARVAANEIITELEKLGLLGDWETESGAV